MEKLNVTEALPSFRRNRRRSLIMTALNNGTDSHLCNALVINKGSTLRKTSQTVTMASHFVRRHMAAKGIGPRTLYSWSAVGGRGARSEAERGGAPVPLRPAHRFRAESTPGETTDER